MGLHQPGSAKSGGGSIQHGTVNRALRVRPNVVRPAAPPLSSVRHRGANPGVVSGSANSDGRNTGAINGTRMNRRH
jgi:hypothetical protein